MMQGIDGEGKEVLVPGWLVAFIDKLLEVLSEEKAKKEEEDEKNRKISSAINVDHKFSKTPTGFYFFLISWI